MSISAEHESTTGADDGKPIGPLTFSPPPGVAALHDRLELAVMDETIPLDQLVELRDLIFRDYFTDRPVFTLNWPDSLYIPSEADSREYWFTEAPADRRYRYSWANTIGGQPAGSHASEKDGRLFAWVNVSGLAPGYTGYAGTGVRFAPSASLSYVRLGADIDLVAEHRWWYLPGTDAGYSNVDYRGTAYLAVWEIDLVTGRWELVRPFGARSLFAFSRQGQGGSAIVSTKRTFADLGATVQLQGGHVYAVGVSFEVQMGHTMLDRRGAPYVKQPGDDIKLWSSLLGTVHSISVSTTKVLIP
ncbi:hypothetical protein ACFVAJ_21560 [Agromyces sp. NPDC057679]|uniref:hypothetical protein n=1 Tax=Agromyces sp. NPDC057679 TaxID=3346207 RepID=UPI00366B110A